MTGRLVLVGTPIGNLEDLSQRAVTAIEGADVLACEDTRRTGRMLARLGVAHGRLVRLDEHTEDRRTTELVERVRGGAVVAVVSDAGMPAVSDPGARLVAAAHDAGVRVEVVPGPFAGVVAAAGSGLLDPSGRFVFEGFLPRRGAARTERLGALAAERRTAVLYESPQRVQATLRDLLDVAGADRRVAVCRELTKLHEELWRGPLGAAVQHWDDREPKGEFVLVLEAAGPAEVADEDIRLELDRRRSEGLSGRDAANRVAEHLGVAPNRVKRLLHDR